MPGSRKQETISQRAKFTAKARELGCEDSEKKFDAALKRIGKAPVPAKAKKKAKRNG